MRLLIAGLTVALLAGCQSNSNKTSTSTTSADSSEVSTTTAFADTLTAAEKADGWQLLFDGTDKNGWHIFNHESDGSAWKVADGVLYLDTAKKNGYQTTGGGDLVTDSTYGNFDLKLQWKISPAGNSGIIFYTQEGPKYSDTWNTGPEMQVLDNDGHPDGKIIKHHAGDLYDLISCNPSTVKPVGEWNQVEVISNNGHLEFHFNGAKVLETTMWDDNWKKMIAGSKFKDMPGFGMFKTGEIALQDHGCLVSYRDVKIKRL